MGDTEHIAFTLRRGAPVDGPQGTLAGVAEPGARLIVQGGAHMGLWENTGSKATPVWQRWGVAQAVRREGAQGRLGAQLSETPSERAAHRAQQREQRHEQRQRERKGD